jgi:U32 family peptidase
MTELLAPGGSIEMVRAALGAGASCVYVGPRGWSRRDPAYELDHHEVLDAIDLAHDRGARLRVALNTDVDPADHDALMQKVEAYAARGVDGFIVRSHGAMREIHSRFPGVTIHASVACNIRDRATMTQARDAGATQFVASTALSTFERIAALKRTADEVGIGLELLIHSNRCVTGVGGCRLYDYFAPYFEEQVVHDSDGTSRLKLIGNPDRGGVCFRPCLGNHEPRIAARFPDRVLTYLERSNNEIYHLLEDVPRYLALGVSTLKIQGREYPAPLIGELTRIYRMVIDQTGAGTPAADVVGGARTALEPVLAARNDCRDGKTRALHERLLARMAAVDDGEASSWDPDAEEARLMRAEADS